RSVFRPVRLAVVRAAVRYNESDGGRLAAAVTYYAFFAAFALALLGFGGLSRPSLRPVTRSPAGTAAGRPSEGRAPRRLDQSTLVEQADVGSSEPVLAFERDIEQRRQPG